MELYSVVLTGVGAMLTASHRRPNITSVRTMCGKPMTTENKVR